MADGGITGHIIGGPADPDYDGATLTADVAIGDLVIFVDDTGDFDEDAAERDALLVVGADLTDDGDIINGVPVAYLTCDDDDSSVTLAAPATAAAAEGDRVYLIDPVSGGLVGRVEVMVAVDDADTTGDALTAYLDVSLLESVGDVDLTDLAVDLDIDEDDQLFVSGFPGLTSRQGRVRGKALDPPDTHIVTALGDQTFDLTYRPIPETEHLRWNGASQDYDDFTRDQWTVTVPDPDEILEVGDVLTMQYLYTDPATKPPPTAPEVIGSTRIFAGDTTVAVPDGTAPGDLLVLAMQAGTFTPSVAAAWLDTVYTGDTRWILGYAVHDGSASYPVTLNSGGADATGVLVALRYSGIVTPTLTAAQTSSPVVIGASSGLFGVVALTGRAGVVAGGLDDSTVDSTGHWTNVAGFREDKASVLIAVTLEAPVDGSWTPSATLNYWNAMTLALS